MPNTTAKHDSELEDQQAKIASLETRVASLEKMLLKIEGAGILVKLVFYLIAPVGAIVYYVRNHFTW